MAGKPQNRLELRRQYDAAEPLDPMEDESELLETDIDVDEETERRPKKKPKKAAAKKAPKNQAKPAARQRIVWAVVNDAFKTVATFEYNQRDLAEAKVADLVAKNKGPHFIQKTKENMPDNAPGLGAVIPRPQLDPTAVKPVDVIPDIEDEPDVTDDDDDDEDDFDDYDDE